MAQIPDHIAHKAAAAVSPTLTGGAPAASRPTEAAPAFDSLGALSPQRAASQLAGIYGAESALIQLQAKGGISAEQAALTRDGLSQLKAKTLETIEAGIRTTAGDAVDARAATLSINHDAKRAALADTSGDPQTIFDAVYGAIKDTAKSQAKLTFSTEDDTAAKEARAKLAADQFKALFIDANKGGRDGFSGALAMLQAMFPPPPPVLVQSDQLITNGQEFMRRAAADGLLSPSQAAQSGLIMGVMQAHIAESGSASQMVRKYSTIAIAGVTHMVPAALKDAATAAGKLSFSSFDEFLATAKQSGYELGGDLKQSASGTYLEVTAQDRMRVTQEMWMLMLEPRNSANAQEKLGEKYLTKLPESLKSQLVSQHGLTSASDITLGHLAAAMPEEARQLATMNTGAMAKANAQNDQEPYTMSYHDVSMWGTLGGKPAEHMEKYARATVGSAPGTRYTYEGRNDGTKLGAVFGPVTGHRVPDRNYHQRDGEPASPPHFRPDHDRGETYLR